MRWSMSPHEPPAGGHLLNRFGASVVLSCGAFSRLGKALKGERRSRASCVGEQPLVSQANGAVRCGAHSRGCGCSRSSSCRASWHRPSPHSPRGSHSPPGSRFALARWVSVFETAMQEASMVKRSWVSLRGRGHGFFSGPRDGAGVAHEIRRMMARSRGAPPTWCAASRQSSRQGGKRCWWRTARSGREHCGDAVANRSDGYT